MARTSSQKRRARPYPSALPHFGDAASARTERRRREAIFTADILPTLHPDTADAVTDYTRALIAELALTRRELAEWRAKATDKETR